MFANLVSPPAALAAVAAAMTLWALTLAGWTSGTPKPAGPFRKLAAFPLFGSVVWLVRAVGAHSGIDGVGALLVLLVGMSMAAWSSTLRGRARLFVGAVAGCALVALLWVLGPAVVSTSSSGAAKTEERWAAWSSAREQQALSAGKPVFVDFTAAWCVTCQVNERMTLGREDVLREFAKRDFVLLRADWTRREPAITAALAQLGRNGVPVYVVRRPGQAAVVLSELLGAEELLAAIRQP